MSIDYVRKFYGVDFKIGDQVQIKPGAGSLVDGCIGKLTSARDARLVVKGRTWKGPSIPATFRDPPPNIRIPTHDPQPTSAQ